MRRNTFPNATHVKYLLPIHDFPAIASLLVDDSNANTYDFSDLILGEEANQSYTIRSTTMQMLAFSEPKRI